MSQALRKLTGVISKSNCIVIFINQLREKVGVMFGNPETTTGGRALKFYASVRLDVRRIEALTGDNVRAYYEEMEREINEAASLVKATPATLADHIKKLQEELKAVKSENESLKAKEAQSALGDVMDKVVEIKGVKFLASALKDVDMNGLRDLGDQLKEKLGSGVIMLISEKGGKVNLMTMATDDVVKKGAHAGNLIKAIAKEVGGGGGGRPTMAQAGGKNPAGIDNALKAAPAVLEGMIK
jgi:alanyl-tRNA synthetase